MSHFNSYEKPASIRSVRTTHTTTKPSGGAPNLRSLGFSEIKQEKAPMSRRKKQVLTVGTVVGVIAVIAIVVPVIYVVGKNNEKSAAAASSAAATATSTGKVSGGTVFPGGSANVSDSIDLSAYTATGNPLNPLAGASSMAVQSGTSGSTVSSYVNGSAVSFTYVNEFGGYYYYDPTNPFVKGGKAQSWSPAIEEEWVWGRDLVRGVNLGGWLVPEPFIGKSSVLPHHLF
jgi:glucan 1,3-beta-glucosidase